MGYNKGFFLVYFYIIPSSSLLQNFRKFLNFNLVVLQSHSVNYDFFSHIQLPKYFFASHKRNLPSW